MAAKKRRNLARDLVSLVRAWDRISQAQELLDEAYNILGDDRLKLPQLPDVLQKLHTALYATQDAAAPFDDAFTDRDKTGGLPEFSKEYGAMTAASYKGGPGEVD